VDLQDLGIAEGRCGPGFDVVQAGRVAAILPAQRLQFLARLSALGFPALPYHIENVLLHGLAAVLFMMVLRRLQVPGARLAAAIFALHPMMVESAGWITERKNVLSQVLFLGLSWLTDGSPRGGGERWRHGRCGPGAIAPPGRLRAGLGPVRGRAAGEDDDFFLPCRAVAGLLVEARTHPVEGGCGGEPPVLRDRRRNESGRHLAGAASCRRPGAGVALSFAERCLIAGRAFWFYVAKLSWPANLCFIYPRWKIDVHSWRNGFSRPAPRP